MKDDIDLMPTQERSAFLPIILLGISVLLFICFQLSGLLTQRSLLQNSISGNEKNVTQAMDTQATFQKLATDLLELSKTDKDAQAIISKYNIRAAESAIEAPSASPEATPESK